jgi:hypothetical protein
VRLAFGQRRYFGERVASPLLPARLAGTKLVLKIAAED